MKLKILLAAVALGGALGASVCQANWEYENATTWNNQMDTPDFSTTYTFYPGHDVEFTNWYWTGAANIAFDNTAQGGWHDINGPAAKQCTLKFEFGLAVTNFQFTTGAMTNHSCDVDWEYSTDGSSWVNLAHFDGPGAGVFTNWDAVVTPMQTFDIQQGVSRIWVRYSTSSNFSGNVYTDPDMAISVTTVPTNLWHYEGAVWNNQMDMPDVDTTYTFHPARPLRMPSYWTGAANIGFDNDAGGGWHDINGGSAKQCTLKYEFSKALSEFQFTTGKMFTHITDTDWDYSTDGINWVNLWHHDAPASHETWDAAVTPLQTFNMTDAIDKIWIRYTTSAAFAGAVDTDMLAIKAKSVLATGWGWEHGTNFFNQMSVPMGDADYEFHPGWINDKTRWHWDRAAGISFLSYGLNDIVHPGDADFGMKFVFSRPLTSFQFTTPLMQNQKCAGDWTYSTDGAIWLTLWHNDVTVDYTNYVAAATPVQTFAVEDDVTKIWLRYDTSAEFMGQVVTDGHMKLNVHTIPLQPLAIVGLAPVSSNIMEMVVNLGEEDAGSLHPESVANLALGTWAQVEHSTNGVDGFVSTNLDYSAESNGNKVIYLHADGAAEFFKITE